MVQHLPVAAHQSQLETVSDSKTFTHLLNGCYLVLFSEKKALLSILVRTSGRGALTRVRASEVRAGKQKEGVKRTSVGNNASALAKCEEFFLLLLWAPALLMSLSGPVSIARPACVPSRPQTAVIRPVMACHRARLARHTGEISNIHLLWLLRWRKHLFCEAFT